MANKQPGRSSRALPPRPREVEADPLGFGHHPRRAVAHAQALPVQMASSKSSPSQVAKFSEVFLLESSELPCKEYGLVVRPSKMVLVWRDLDELVGVLHGSESKGVWILAWEPFDVAMT